MDYAEVIAESNRLVQQAVPLLVRDPTGGQAPTYTHVDTSQLQLDQEMLRTSRDVTNANIDLDQQRLSAATDEEKAAFRAKAVAEGDRAQADLIKAERDAAVFAQMGEIFGVTPENMAALVQQINIERPKANAKLTEIEAMQAVSPMDDLLTWWGNQINLPSKISAYNTHAALLNSMQDSMDAYIESGSKAATFVHKGLPTITAAQAKATADAASADAAAKSALADQNLARHSVDFATKRFATDLGVAGQTLHTTQLQLSQNIQEYQTAIHAIQFADNHANRLLNAAKLMETLAKNEDEMAQRKSTEVLLKNFDTATGRPVGTTTYNVWRAMSQPQRENMVAIGAGSFGPDPVSAAANYFNARPGALVNPEVDKLMKHIRDTQQQISVIPQIQILDEKQKIDKIRTVMTQRIQEEIANASKPGNPFYELSPARMVEGAQINKESIVAKVLQPLIEKKADNIPTELVVMTIAGAFKNPNEAASAIADYYKRNMALRNTVLNPKAAHIELPDTYLVTSRIGPMSTVRLDLTKPEDVTKYLFINKYKATVRDVFMGPIDRMGGI